MFAPDDYEPPDWLRAWIVAKALKVPPWVVESEAPIHWVERTLVMLEAEELAMKWAEQKAKKPAKKR